MPKSVKTPKIHTQETATMLTFANPPAADTTPIAVADSCSRKGFDDIGIHVGGDNDIADFSLIDEGMCAALANSIEICVDSKGFTVGALTGTFVIMHQKSIQITFANFRSGLAQLLVPKP